MYFFLSGGMVPQDPLLYVAFATVHYRHLMPSVLGLSPRQGLSKYDTPYVSFASNLLSAMAQSWPLMGHCGYRDWEPPSSMFLLRRDRNWDVLELVPCLVSGFGGAKLSATLAFSFPRKRAENHSEVSSVIPGLKPNERVWGGVGRGPDLSGQGDKDARVGLTKVTRSSPKLGFSIFKSWSPYLLRAPISPFPP